MSSAEDDSGLSLQAIDLCFGLPITPLRSKGGSYCRIVLANPIGQLFEFGEPAVCSLNQPAIQISFSTLCQHHHKPLSQLVRSLEISMALEDAFNMAALFLIKLVGLTDKEP